MKQLVLKNETLTTGNVYLQGPQNQMRQFLKGNLRIKPNCMTDKSLNLSLKVMYSQQGQFMEEFSNDYNVDLSFSSSNLLADGHQPQLMLKYRFLYQGQNGDLHPIYNPNLGGSFPDIVKLQLKGYAGSGFEKCVFRDKNLYADKQYDVSHIPMLRSGYRVFASASYKDY